MNTDVVSQLVLNLQNSLQKQNDLQDYVKLLQSQLFSKNPLQINNTKIQNELFDLKQRCEHLSFQLEQQIIANVQLNKENQEIKTKLNEKQTSEQMITQDNATQTEIIKQSYAMQLYNIFSHLVKEDAETVDKTINSIFKHITDIKGYKIVISSQKAIDQIKLRIKAQNDYQHTYRLIPDLIWLLEQNCK
ncbi:Hypothetical_protein [Hexamita inflata]|uniref:Hypothetical_protein n=1 Tax=Hexamita inflata TaxID=28002 RepID=A0AA86RK13_9EUKA|nr:Hypothetical protein HINF_LOCUS65742 [Hexamita inflata]